MEYYEYIVMGIILLPAFIFSLIAQIKVNSAYSKYNKVESSCGLTAKEVAEKVLSENGIDDVTIKRVKGKLTDYYSDKEKVIALSDDVYDSKSVAAIGVALHEVGHAIQYSENYKPVILRNLMVVACNLSNKLLWPLVFLGLIFNVGIQSGDMVGSIFLWAGIGFFGLAMLFNLITLPVEYNASHRAKEAMEKNNILTKEECRMAAQVLNAAALTYVAAFMVSVLNLVRFLLVVKGGKNKD